MRELQKQIPSHTERVEQNLEQELEAVLHTFPKPNLEQEDSEDENSDYDVDDET